MSTHARIAYKNASGLYDSIYCHNDGYPDYMLGMLTTHYSSNVRVAELIDCGDASFIAKRLTPTSNTHSFDNPQEDVCIFYCRDRNEPWDYVAPLRDGSKEDLMQAFEDYVYIFEDGEWAVYSNGEELYV